MLPKSAPGENPKTSERAPTVASVTAARARARTGREGLSQTVAAAASLLNEGDLAHAGIATDARDLLLDEIAPDPDQPRRHFDTLELQILADDITRRGVLQPVLVRPPLAVGEPYRLVAGERRWRAARLAGKVRIPARIRTLSDDEVQAAQLAENVLRAELTDIEKGRALRRLYELRKTTNAKTTWEDIAGEVGLGRSRMHDLFHLAELPEAIAALIETGRLSGSHGILLQRAGELLPEHDLLVLAEQAARPEERRTGSYALSVAQLRQHLLERQNPSKPETQQAHVTQHSAADEAASGQNGPSQNSLKAKSESTARFNSPDEVRPAVAEILQALFSNTLTPTELNALFAAVDQARNITPEP